MSVRHRGHHQRSEVAAELVVSTVLTFVLSVVFKVGTVAIGLQVPYLVCLGIAFVLCFGGVFIWVHTDSPSGSSSGWSWLD